MTSFVRTILREPLTHQLTDLDAPDTTHLHREIIRRKPFLRRFYEDAYGKLDKEIELAPPGLCVEIGSGAGFLKEHRDDVVTSDVCHLPWLDLALDGTRMPFTDSSVSVFFLLDVFHHLPDVEGFLAEVDRVLVPGGRLLMIEPANTLWSRFIFSNFHHEPFEVDAGWRLERGGRLSEANQALPWIVFVRDGDTFVRKFPRLSVELELYTQFRYLISGGLSMRQLLPSFCYDVVSACEALAAPLNRFLGYFMIIRLTKAQVP